MYFATNPASVHHLDYFIPSAFDGSKTQTTSVSLSVHSKKILPSPIRDTKLSLDNSKPHNDLSAARMRIDLDFRDNSSVVTKTHIIDVKTPSNNSSIIEETSTTSNNKDAESLGSNDENKDHVAHKSIFLANQDDCKFNKAKNTLRHLKTLENLLVKAFRGELLAAEDFPTTVPELHILAETIMKKTRSRFYHR